MALVAEAMGSLVPKLTELLKEEYKLQTGVREKINFLKNELEDMHAALRKVGDMHPDLLDEQVRIWARKVRELSYDMEDVIDAFLVRVDGREPANPGCLERLVHMMCGLFTKTKVRHQISGIVQDINTKLQEVSKARERYIASDLLANPAATQSSTHDPRILSLNTDATELVGIDGPRNDIIKILSLEGDDVPLGKIIKVSIVGSGGMGKTTLAKAVYDSVKGKFQCSAFVPVGQNQDLKRVFMDILNDLDKEKFDNIHSTKKDVRLLMKEVYEFLENKRYIIVIDDIWKFDAWDMIANVLGDSSCGSRVIVTTRISEIAEEVGHVYEIKQLSDVDSRMLLHRRILSGEDQCPDDDYDLEEVCDEILRKCEGVPLAIVTTSSLLESKPREDWSELYRSIGLGAKDNRHVDNTMKILSLSYYHLPYHLRTCLLYLSAFPEDYVIGKQTLIWRWIGEGFVCKEEGRDLYEVGESYFNELVKRRMIMPIEAENEDYVLGCRVHDMVLGLVRSLSSSENFVTLLGIEQYSTSHQGYGRRISILSSKIGLPPVANLGTAESQVRSFSANGLSYIDVLPLPAPAKFEAVRVLALQNCESLQDLHHLEYVGSLLHLRYLALTNSPLSELPNGIGGHLRFLETLDLWGTGIEQVPSSVGKLTQLLCLQADIKTRVPDWIGKLTSLQELWMWPDAAAAGQFVKELGKMKDLRVLCTQFMGASASDVIESLRSLRKIQKVHTFDRWAVVGQCVPWEQGFITPQCLQFLCLRCLIFTNLPPWINPSLLPNLSNLSLSLQVLRQADMEILGRLRVLRRLELFAMGSAIIRIGIHDTLLFRKLRFCTMATTSIRFVSTVPPPAASAAITTPVSVMPCLELLHFSLDVHFFKDCNLAFDIGLEHLPSSLRTVKVFVLCHLANEEDVKEAEAALLHSVSIHPSRPDLQLERLAEDKMVPSHLKDDQ